MYPVAFLYAVVLLTTNLYTQIPEPIFHQSLLLAVSLSLGSIQLIKYLSHARSRIFHITTKICLGFSLGGIIVWTILAPIIWPLRLFSLIVSMLIIVSIGSTRILYLRGSCSGCKYHGDWDICYGMRGINRYHSFKHIRSRRSIERLIFNKNKKMSASAGGPVARFNDPEPNLKSENKWLYHEKKLEVPWLPRMNKEIERYENIPGKHRP